MKLLTIMRVKAKPNTLTYGLSIVALIAQSLLLQPVWAMGDPDPLIATTKIEQFEWHQGDELAVKAHFSLGKDIDKWLLKGEGEFELGGVSASNKLERETELSALYSRAITPFWNVLVGLRWQESQADSSTQAELSFQGLAPYFVESFVSVFIDAKGQVSFRGEFEQELMLTQKLYLEPKLEVLANAYEDEERGEGKGLSKTQLSLRLGYEVVREFAPYVGVAWRRYYADTAKFHHGKDDASTALIGFTAWF